MLDAMLRPMFRQVFGIVLVSVFGGASCGMQTPAAPAHLEWVPASPAGDVAPLVTAEQTRARRDGRQLLVYVGAKWCEPCQRFHHAAEAGKLDASFGRLRLLEFDLDRDSERLAVAGYVSRFIPLIAAPGADGRASGRQMEGSVKGDGAVAEIVPRLGALLLPR
jgi:hypothetical protein